MLQNLKKSLLLALLCSYHVMPAQTLEQGTIIPPAPRSREFEKFIKYDVSLAKGLVQNNLNFYNIELDGVSIPIGIAYHGSGITFGQTNGDVGLGWQLSPGFRVSRTVYGRLDEAYNMPDMHNGFSGQTIGYYLNNNFSSPFQRDLYIARYYNLSPDGDIPAIYASSNNFLDGEFDQFSFGLPGNSGSFIITDRANKVVTTLDNSALKNISYNLSGGVISDINAVDGNAVKYKFGTADQNNEGRQINIGGVMTKFNTAWMLSEVTTPFDNRINFGYDTVTESTSGMPTYTKTVIDGTTNGINDCYPSIAPLGGTESPASPFNYSSKVLTAITTPNEIVTFTRNPDNNMVTSILVSRLDGSQIKKVSLFYSQPATRIFLDSVHVSGTGSTVLERYRFEYTSKNLTFRNYNSFGYNCDIAYGGENLANLYGTFNYNRLLCPGGVIGDVTTFGGINKAIAPSTTGMLKKIVYPTGGYREFEYSSNRYKVDGSNGDIWGDGLRISKISSNDGGSAPTLVREYLYGDGVRKFDPAEGLRNLRQRLVLARFNESGGGISIHSVKKTTQSSILDEEITQAMNQPDNGWYSNVTELYNEGKIEYEFEIPRDESVFGSFPTNSGFILTNRPAFLGVYSPWNKPQLKEKRVFKESAGSFSILRKEEFEYYVPSNSPSESFIGFKVQPFALADPRFGTGASTTEPSYSLYTNSGIQSVFNYATYTITRGDVLLKKKTSTDYGQNGSNLTSSTEFTYSENNLIATEKITDSKINIRETKYKYPFNYPNLVASDNISLGIKNLSDINAVNRIVESTTYLRNGDGSNNRLVNSSFSSYKTTLPVTDKIFQVEVLNPVSNFQESGVASGAISKDSRYVEQISFEQYSSKGKLLQKAKPGDTKEVYLWGYKGEYPVAKIVGSDYQTAAGLINQTVLDNVSGTYSELQIRTELNKLRTLPNTLVSTYTYLPLIGPVSMTDPSGKITLYDYDELGRLSKEKTAAGLERASYCYNYAGQPTPCAALAPTGSIASSTLPQLALIPETSGALPVTLIDFKASRIENTSHLTWSTSNESNSEKFEIERSSDGVHWTFLGNIIAAGTSSSEQKYSYTDARPLTGENLYRLKMLDADASFTYSRIQSVSFAGTEAYLFPNPLTVGENLNIRIDDLSKIDNISIFNKTGKLIYKQQAARKLNTAVLPVGLYVIQITYKDGSITTHKIVKQ